MATPVPIGPGASFSRVPANTNTARFTIGEGNAIVVFQPVDVNDPGTVTLYDSDAAVILTMDREGYSNAIVPPGGKTYYFFATKGANVLAFVQPSVWGY